ncbi:helix-turn-helix transcriptional regulator, partial [Noviherbaspirillum sp. ST9]
MNLELEPGFFDKYGLSPTAISPLAFSRPGSVLLMVLLYRELRHRDENFSDSIHMLLLDAVAGWKQSDRQLMPSWVNTIDELLRDKWNAPVSLRELAGAVDVHPVTISKYFARYFGCSLGEYRRKLKVERAIALISSTNQSLTEIGYACGFFDQ